MNTTIIMYQVLGIVFSIFGLSILVNKKSIIGLLDDTIHSKGILWILGFITLVCGALMVVFNNSWNTSWELFVCIMSWLILVKGIVILIYPNLTIKAYKKRLGNTMLLSSGFVALVLGVIFLHMSTV